MAKKAPATVLLLDDQSSGAAYVEALRQAGMNVVAIDNSETALDTAERIRPRVFIATFDSATREDRLTLCRNLRADPRTIRIPILFAARDVMEGDTALATDPGVLVLRMAHPDVSKLVAAVEGVLAAQRPEPLRASLRPPRNPKVRRR